MSRCSIDSPKYDDFCFQLESDSYDDVIVIITFSYVGF